MTNKIVSSITHQIYRDLYEYPYRTSLLILLTLISIGLVNFAKLVDIIVTVVYLTIVVHISYPLIGWFPDKITQTWICGENL